MAKKKRSRPSKMHRKSKAPVKKQAVASYAKRRKTPVKMVAHKKSASLKKLRKKIGAALDAEKSAPSGAGLSLQSLYTLVSAGLEKLTDRVEDVEERINQLTADGVVTQAAQTLNTATSKTSETTPVPTPADEIPGVSIENDKLEVDTDDTWKWHEGHMLGFVKLVSEMNPPALDIYVGRPRKMRKVLFDWMREQGLEPTDLPPKGESFPEDGGEANSAVSGRSAVVMGVTATRHGITSAQAASLRKMIEKTTPDELHHGDCEGGDEDVHEIFNQWRKNIASEPRIHVHPPDDDKLRARVKLHEHDVLHEEKPYHARNKDIVNASTIMVGLPHTAEEELRSGTWSTIRYAKKVKANLFIILPNGKVVRR